MANLIESDKFVIARNGSYYSANYSTVIDGLAPIIAKQGDEVSGVAGIMYPGDTMTYNEDTGELNVLFPDSLNFVGQIIGDYQPNLGSYDSGDFFIVVPNLDQNPDGTIILFESDWPGVSSTEYYSVSTVTKGTNYRGKTGRINNFGDGIYTSCVNLTNPASPSGLSFSARVSDGYLSSDDFLIRSGGFGYEVDDIIELKQLDPASRGESTHVKVTSVDASKSVTGFSFCDSLGEDAENTDALGGHYFASPDSVSYSNSIDTLPRNATVTGTGLLLDIQMQLGEIINVELSPYSAHTGFKTGDRLFIYNPAIGNFGDSVVEIEIDEDDKEDKTFTVAFNDKLIYSTRISENGSNTVNGWVHVKDATGQVTITDITTPVLTIDDDFYNPHLAMDYSRSATQTNTFQISIKNANAILDDQGSLDVFNSHSGFITPSEKLKINALPDSVGIVSSLSTSFKTNSYTGQLYSDVNLTELDGEYNIQLNKSGVGRYGMVEISNDVTIKNSILERLQGLDQNRNSNLTRVPNVEQVANNFTPLNLFLLPSY